MIKFRAGFNCWQNRAIQSVHFIGKIPRQILLLFLFFILAILAFGGYVYWQNKQILPQTKTLSTRKLPQETRENLKIDRKISTEETSIASQKTGYTKSVEVVITNSSDKPLRNVRFVERIPKEIAKSIEEVTFNIQPTAILNKDPEALWEFEEIKPKGGMKIIYETWQKVTDPTQGEPKIDELVKAVVETMAEEKPKAEIPEEPKDYTSIASLLKKVAIEKKEGEVIDKEFLVHGIIIKPFKLEALQQFLGGLFAKAAQMTLDAFMPGEVVTQPVKEALGKFKDAGIESTYNFIMKDLHLILGDLPLESGIEIDGAQVPPIFTLYNWPFAATPELEPGHVFVGKVKLVKLLNGTYHLQILPGFKYDDPLGYVSLYELSPKLNEYKGKELTTIGRVAAVEEKEGALWVKVTLDGYRLPSARADKIYGYSLWASLPKDFLRIPKNNLVLTLTGVIKEALFNRPIEYKDNNRFYLEVGETSEVTTSLPKARIVDDKRVYLGDKLLLDIKDYEPGCSGIDKILYSSTNDYFLVILGCFEMDNKLFLFKADGSDKKEITGKWDVLNNWEVEWDADGKSFVYHRINSFGADKKTLERLGVKNAPEEGMVRYIIATGEKTVIGPYKKPAATPTASPEAESGKTISVAEFEKLPKGCLKEPPDTYLMVVKVEEDWGEAFTGKNYKVSDQTGTTTVSIHQSELKLGKTYQFKGCKEDICASPDAPCWTIFEVWDDQWPDAIVEK